MHYAVYLGSIKAYDRESSSVMLSLKIFHLKDKSFIGREESFHFKSFSGSQEIFYKIQH